MVFRMQAEQCCGQHVRDRTAVLSEQALSTVWDPNFSLHVSEWAPWFR